MKLDYVLTATNNNSNYIDFVPNFIKAWKKLYPQVKPLVIVINNSIPENLKEYKDNLVLFEPIPNVSTAFTSQYIRMLYPAILDCPGGVLITDMDMLPMNRSYYTKNIEQFSDNKFIYMRNVLMDEYKQIAMCYNVATPKTWANIFNIHSLQDIIERLTDKFNSITYVDGWNKAGWCTDQIDLYKYIMDWHSKTGDFIYLNDNTTGYQRLDRLLFNTLNPPLAYAIKNGVFSDYHCLRPYNYYKQINDLIVDLL